MEITNNKLSSFQLAILGMMMGNGLFVGYGIIIMITLSKQDAWLTLLMATILGIIPILLIILTINYLPDKNIFEKTKVLFGKIGGTIVNTILMLIILTILLLILWTTIYFSLTQYLTKVPYLFVGIVYSLTAAYAVTKGIETIVRTNQISFFIAILLITFIWTGLYPNFQLEQIKPIMANGIKPLIGDALIALSYAFPPLLTLLVIPKNDIINNKKYIPSLIVGFLLSLILMAVTFLLIVGVITVDLAQLFRYPAYFTQYKIDIAGFLQGVENFLSFHWILNDFVTIMMTLYFVNRYIKDTFKVKQEKTMNIITLVLIIIATYVSGIIFKNSDMGVEFMKTKFPYYIALPSFVLLVIITIISRIKQLRNKKKNVSYNQEYLPVVIKS